MAVQDKVLSLIGLAKKAGKISSGSESVLTDGRAGKIFAVVIASDVSAGSTKKITNMCNFYEIPLFTYGDKDSLGKALGKEFCAVVGISDQGFAEAIEKKIAQM